MISCEFCGKTAEKSAPWVCNECITAERSFGMKTLENSILEKVIVDLLTAIYEELPEDKLSMEARDFIVEMNDQEDVDDVCICLADIIACLDNWHGKEAEVAKMRLDAEYERLWKLTGPRAGNEPTSVPGYRH